MWEGKRSRGVKVEIIEIVVLFGRPFSAERGR